MYEFDLCKHVASDTLTGASEDRGGLANTSKRPEPVEDCVLANTTLDSAGVTADASPRELSAPRTGPGAGGRAVSPGRLPVLRALVCLVPCGRRFNTVAKLFFF